MEACAQARTQMVPNSSCALTSFHIWMGSTLFLARFPKDMRRLELWNHSEAEVALQAKGLPLGTAESSGERKHKNEKSEKIREQNIAIFRCAIYLY